jgi:hypothetical protein
MQSRAVAMVNNPLNAKGWSGIMVDDQFLGVFVGRSLSHHRSYNLPLLLHREDMALFVVRSCDVM